jgi:hypothetical protein
MRTAAPPAPGRGKVVMRAVAITMPADTPTGMPTRMPACAPLLPATPPSKRRRGAPS